MMLDINVDSIRQGFWKHFPLAAAVGVLIALQMAAVLLGNVRISEERPMPMLGALAGQDHSNTKMLGLLLYTEYLYPLQIAAVLLLVAIIAAIALTLRERKNSRYTNPAQQVRVRSKDRFEMLKIEPSRPPAPAPDPTQAGEKQP